MIFPLPRPYSKEGTGKATNCLNSKPPFADPVISFPRHDVKNVRRCSKKIEQLSAERFSKATDSMVSSSRQSWDFRSHSPCLGPTESHWWALGVWKCVFVIYTKLSFWLSYWPRKKGYRSLITASCWCSALQTYFSNEMCISFSFAIFFYPLSKIWLNFKYLTHWNSVNKME